jgi:hypothetical protein
VKLLLHISDGTHFLAESPVGVLTLAKTDGVLTGLFMGELTDASAQIFACQRAMRSTE